MLAFVPVLAWAQKEGDGDLDITRDIENRFQEAPTYTEPRHVNTAVYEYPHRPVSLKRIKITPIVQKALRRKALVQIIKSGDVQISEKPILINVHELADEHGFFYIVEKDGRVYRRVHDAYVVDIQQVTEMVAPPKAYSEAEHKEVAPEFDRKLGIVPELGLRFGQANNKWTADLLNRPKSANSYTTNFIGNLMLDWEEKFRLGATFQYETATVSVPGGTANYKNPSFGLVFQSPKSDWGGGPWRVGAQVRTGPFATLTIPNGNRDDEVKLRTTVIQFDWMYVGNNRWGDWNLGIAVQRDYPKIRNQRTASYLESDARTNDQVGVFFIQGLKW